jgi:thioredoxin-like negative regulator of GroEL
MRSIAVRLAAVLAISLSVAGSAPAEEAPRTASLTTAAKPLLRHGVFRFTSYPQAWTAAQESNRPILVYATAPNCPHCVRMISETFAASPVKRLATDSFETVYVDRAEQPELAAKLKIRYFPTTIVVAPNNQVLDVIEGYVDAATLNQRLKTSFAAHESATRK